MRAWSGLVRFAVFWFPLLFLLGFGGLYLAGLLRWLTDARVPIALDLPNSPIGARVEAGRAVLNLAQGRAILSDARLLRRDGTVIATAARVTVDGLAPELLRQPITRTRVEGLRGELVRRRDGSFEVAQLLPPGDDTPSTTPFVVEVTDAAVQLIDQAATPPVRQSALARGVRVEGIDRDLRVAGFISLQAGLSTRLRLVRSRDLWLAEGDVRSPALERLLPILTAMPETRDIDLLKRVRLAGAQVSGPFRLRTDARGLGFRLDGPVAARSLAYEDLRLQPARFAGFLTESGAAGRARATVESTPAEATGAVVWAEGIVAGAQVRGSAGSVADLPRAARRAVGTRTSFRALSAEGWLSLRQNRPRFQGNVRADRLATGGETIDAPRATLAYADGEVLLRNVDARWMGMPVRGAASYDSGSGRLLAVTQRQELNLDALAQRFAPLRDFRGRATASLVVEGTADRPRVRFEGEAIGTYLNPQIRPLYVAASRLAGTYEDGAFALERAFLDTNAGTLIATGRTLPGDRVEGWVDTGTIQLSSLRNDLVGQIRAAGRFAGTLRRPRFEGRVEGYDFGTPEVQITAARTPVRFDGERVELLDLVAYRGAAKLAGRAAYHVKTGALSGQATGRRIALSSFVDPQLGGTVTLDRLVLGGTLNRPEAQVRLTAPEIVAGDARVEDVEAEATLAGSRLAVRSVRAGIGGGTLRGEGVFDLRQRLGRGSLRAEGIEIGTAAPGLSRFATVRGKVGGTARLSAEIGRGPARWTARSEIRVDDLRVNDTLLGSGALTAAKEGDAVTASGEIGQLDRFLSLHDTRVDLKAKTFAAAVDLFNFQLKDIISSALASAPNLSTDVRNRLQRLEGAVTLGTTASGSFDRPDFRVPTFTVAGLRYEDTPIGDLTLNGEGNEERIRLNQLQLAGPIGTLKVSGSGTRSGELELTGDLLGLDLATVSAIEPRVGLTDGRADLAFVIGGTTERPTLMASLSAQSLFATEADPQGLRVLFDTLEYGRAETGSRLTANGNYFIKGFQGQLSAEVPFDDPVSLANDRPLKGRVTVSERPLKELAEFAPALDPDRSEGVVRGNVEIGGTLDELAIDGSIQVLADRLALKRSATLTRIDTDFEKLDARLTFTQQRLRAAITTQGSRGGTISAYAETPLPDLGRLLEDRSGDRRSQLLNRRLTGEIIADRFVSRVDRLLPQPGVEDRSSVAITLAANIQLGGTLGRPRISGDVEALQLDAILPSFGGEESVAEVPEIDPEFDLAFRLAPQSRIRASIVDMNLGGGGRIGGRLSEPSAEANFAVEGGRARLPGGLVRLQPGGSVVLRYVKNLGGSAATLNVDLLATTALTIANAAGTPERYDIDVTLRGDLLDPNGINLTASSDPPGLSQTRILGLLGQTEALASILTGDGNRNTQQQIREILTGVALPVVFDPIGQRIADVVGLDYVSLDVGVNSQISLSAAKSFGRQWFLQASRQVTQPRPGDRLLYDVRLVYRPRFRNRLLRNVSFSAGQDQDRPWKIAVNYETRF